MSSISDRIYSENLKNFIGDWEKFARDWLKKNIIKLPKASQTIFKRMYSHKDLEKPINQIVDDMESFQLDWAMKQIENTKVA